MRCVHTRDFAGKLQQHCTRLTGRGQAVRMAASGSATPAFTNRLAHEKSPYLLQHQHNPVCLAAWLVAAPPAAAAGDMQGMQPGPRCCEIHVLMHLVPCMTICAGYVVCLPLACIAQSAPSSGRW
jgi:hypothetical protein